MTTNDDLKRLLDNVQTSLNEAKTTSTTFRTDFDKFSLETATSFNQLSSKLATIDTRLMSAETSINEFKVSLQFTQQQIDDVIKVDLPKLVEKDNDLNKKIEYLTRE